MFQTVLLAAVGVAILFFMFRLVRSSNVYVIGSRRYEVYRIARTNDSFEYRTEPALPTVHRGDVRLFRDGTAVSAVSLRAECTPDGTMWAHEVGSVRSASAEEVSLFQVVCA